MPDTPQERQVPLPTWIFPATQAAIHAAVVAGFSLIPPYACAEPNYLERFALYSIGIAGLIPASLLDGVVHLATIGAAVSVLVIVSYYSAIAFVVKRGNFERSPYLTTALNIGLAAWGGFAVPWVITLACQ